MWKQVRSAGLLVLALVVFVLLLGASYVGVDAALAVAEAIVPFLSDFAMFALAVGVLVLVPMSFIRRTRDCSSVGLFIVATIIAIALWVWSAVHLQHLWGTTGVVVGVLIGGVGVIPLAFIALLGDGEWADCVHFLAVLAAIIAAAVYGVIISSRRR